MLTTFVSGITVDERDLNLIVAAPGPRLDGPVRLPATPNGHDEDRRVGPGHVVVACNSFKGSLTAPEVAQVVAAGLRDAAPDREVRTVVIADGGDGTLDAALSVGFERVSSSTGVARCCDLSAWGNAWIARDMCTTG